MMQRAAQLAAQQAAGEDDVADAVFGGGVEAPAAEAPAIARSEPAEAPAIARGAPASSPTNGGATPAQTALQAALAQAAERAGPPPPAKRPGRNDPCWCGSGKKYKKCHMDADLRASP
jgi:hypothetical protein